MTQPDRSVRDRLLAFVRAHPGASIQDLADHLGVGRTAVVHHVRRLARQRELVSQGLGRRRLHFAAAATPPEQRGMLGLLRLRMARCVLEELRADPSVSWRGLARRLRVAPHTIRWHVARLRDEGLLHVETHGGRKHALVLHPELLSVHAAPAPFPAPQPTVGTILGPPGPLAAPPVDAGPRTIDLVATHH